MIGLATLAPRRELRVGDVVRPTLGNYRGMLGTVVDVSPIRIWFGHLGSSSEASDDDLVLVNP